MENTKLSTSLVIPLLLLSLFVGFSNCQINPPPTDDPLYRCENLTEIEICSGIGYSTVSFPNYRNQETQADANAELINFTPLIQVVCSEALVHLLCSVYAPFCDPDPRFSQIRVPPCRELCQHVRDGCEDDINSFGFDWPPHLDCARYPERSDTNFCPPDIGVVTIPTNIPTDPRQPSTTEGDTSPTGGETTMPSLTGDTTDDGTVTGPGRRNQCPMQLMVIGGLQNKSYEFAGIDNCGVHCTGLYFTDLERNTIAPVFVLLFAVICVIFTLFTVATFLIDRRRFHYPERPIIFLSFCYLIISLSYIVGTISKLAGGENQAFACSDEEKIQELSYVFQSLPNSEATYKSASCVILFVLVYFFQMASAIWWIILTLTWFLAAALKWGEEAVEKLWLLYHIIAWSVPAIQVILILALRLVDGDQLSGICYTGNMDQVGLGVFVFMPLTVYLLIGVVLLVIGFLALVNIRRQVVRDAVKSRKISRLMMRIAIYSVFYITPNIILLLLILYQLSKNNSWEQSYVDECRVEIVGPDNIETCQASVNPSFAAFLLKYIVLFLIGICSTSWILSSKTFAAWQKFFCSCGCATHPPQYDLPEKRDMSLHIPHHHPQTAV